MKKIDIFYADDDEDDIFFFNEAVREISTNSGYQINLHIHLNGVNLIENATNKIASTAMVFLDLNMQFKSGFEILETIRNQPKINKLPVIIFSTSTCRENIEKSRILGANFYAVKPPHYAELLKIITSFIEVNWENYKLDKNSFLYKNLK